MLESLSMQCNGCKLLDRSRLGRNTIEFLRAASVCLSRQLNGWLQLAKSVYFGFVNWCYSPIIYMLIVASVSIYDIVLTIKYAMYLKYMEENPIGRWLMRLDELENGRLPDLTWFLTAKSIGTIFVLMVLLWLIMRKGKLGHPVAIGVSAFQLVLAAYLTFGTTPS